MTRERRINVLALILAVVLVVVLRPVDARLGEGDSSVRCHIANFVAGTDPPAWTEACRGAYKGRAAASLVLLAGISLLASQLVPRREPRNLAPPPPARPPGEDASLMGGLRHAVVDPNFRLLAGAGIGLLLALVAITRPVTVRAVPGGNADDVDCGLREQLFGGSDASVTAVCRQAFAGRAVGGLLIVGCVGVVVALLVWLVQYHRGAALGAIWHRTGVPRALVTRAGLPIAALLAVAIVAAGESAPPAAADASGPPVDVALPPPRDDAPLATDISPAPTFVPPSPVVATPPSSRPPSTVRPLSTTTTTVPDEPLVVRDQSWFAANPNPLDSGTVPEDGLPVGTLLGEDDVHAFFRWTGAGTTLTLVESAAPGAQRFVETAMVDACAVIDETWEPTTGGDIEDEPAYDEDVCVAASRADDGTWTIDLASFDEAVGRRGVALVPASDSGGASFRVTLEQQSESVSSANASLRASRTAGAAIDGTTNGRLRWADERSRATFPSHRSRPTFVL